MTKTKANETLVKFNGENFQPLGCQLCFACKSASYLFKMNFRSGETYRVKVTKTKPKNVAAGAEAVKITLKDYKVSFPGDAWVVPSSLLIGFVQKSYPFDQKDGFTCWLTVSQEESN